MACVENRGRGTVICLGLLVFVTSLCHCTKMTRLKALDEKRGNVAQTQSQAGRSHQHHGRLLIGQNPQQAAKPNGTNTTESVLDVAGYQADMGWWQTKKLQDYNDWPKSDIEATQRLLESDSKVECTQSSMKLLVHDAAFTPAALIFVDRGHLSPLSLAKLPSSCGYTIRSTQSSLVLVAPYDGCFVIMEENSYVLPLRWWGLPVKMSCPVVEQVSSNPPMVTCHAEGMVVRTEWTNSASNIKANVDENWESLLTAAHRCAFGVVEHPEGVVISVRYNPCLRKKDGFYTLELAADKETKISCPSLLASHIKPRKDLLNGPVQQSEIPSGWTSPVEQNPPLTPRSGQTGSQIPDFPQSPEIPSKPKQVPKEYNPLSNSFFHPYSTSPESTLNKQPQIPTPTRSAVLKNTEKYSQHFPFYQSPIIPQTTWSPVTKLPQPKHEEDPLQYQFNHPHKFPQKSTEPPLSYPKGQEQRRLDLPYDTQTSSQTPPSYPLYLEKVPEKPSKHDPTVSEKLQDIENLPVYHVCTQQAPPPKDAGASQGHLSQSFYLLCTQMKLALKNTASQQPQPEIPQSQQSHPFSLSCTQQTQVSDPTMSRASHPESSPGQTYQSFYLFCAQVRPSSQPSGVTWPPQHEATQSHRYQAFFPYYVQPISKPAVTQPLPPVTQGQAYQQLFPFNTQPEPTQKPVTKPQQPIIPQGQLNQQFFHFFTRPNPKPADVTQPTSPATPRSHEYQPLLDSLTQQKPSSKPDLITESPQPATPEDQGYHPIYQFFSQQNQSPKPAVTQPPKSATPQGQVHQPLLDFFSKLQPTPQSATSEDQGYHPVYHFFSQQNQSPKPAVTQPPKSATPQGQVYQPLLDYFKLQPTPQPATSEDQVYHPIYDFFFQQKPSPKPAVTQPPKSATPQGQVYQPLLDYFNNLQSNSKPATPPQGQVYQPLLDYLTQQKQTLKPAATQPPQPSTHQSPLYEQSVHFFSKPDPTVSQLPQTDISRSHIYLPFYHLQKPEPHEPQLGLKPSNPQPEASRSQIDQSYLLQSNKQPMVDKKPKPLPQPSQPTIHQGQAHKKMCLYNQLWTESQLAKIPSEIILGKVYGPCQLPWKVGAQTSQFLNPSLQFQPVYCPQSCPSGLTNCCLQIAFHHHFHIAPEKDGKDVPQFHVSRQSSQTKYPDVSSGLESGPVPQKLAEAAKLQSLRDHTSAHFSPLWAPLTASQKQEYFQPLDGNPASIPRSSRIKTANQLPVNPYFVKGSSNPQWLPPQHFGLLNLEQRKFEGSNDPSAHWASDGGWLETVEQKEPFNSHFPQQQNGQSIAGNVYSKPNIRSYINQHSSYTTGEQSEPDIEQSLHQSEFKSSTHNFKRAVDQFFYPHYMPRDAPNSNRNKSEASNNYRAQLYKNNSTNLKQPLSPPSGPQGYVLLQHGPPSKKPVSFSDHPVDLRHLGHGADSEIKSPPEHQSTNENLEPLQGESQVFKSPGKEVSNPLLDVNYIERFDDQLDVPLFHSVLDDSDLVYLPPEQYFSAIQLKPQILESFEQLWKSMTPSDSSKSFAAHVLSKRTSAEDQKAEGMNRPF